MPSRPRNSAFGLPSWVIGLLGGLALLAALFFGWQAWERMQARNGPVVLTIAAGTPKSDAVRLMRDVADVVARHSSSLRLRVIAGDDSSHNMSLVSQGLADLAVVRDVTPAGGPVRLVASLFTDYFYFISRLDNAVRRIEDLDQAQVLVPPFGSDAQLAFWQVADHYDLSPEDINWRADSFASASKRLLKGDVDVIFNVSSLRDPELLNLVFQAGLQNIELRFIAIDQAEAMRLKRPLLHVGEIVKGAVDGQVRLPLEPVRTSSVERLLVAGDQVPAVLVEELTRILFEYRNDLVLRTPLAASITEPDNAQGFRIPLHDGARWYFERDKPSFLETNAELMSFYIAAAAVLWSGFAALRSRLGARRKNRADEYNQRLLRMADAVRAASDGETLIEIVGEHEKVLEDMVVALDEDRVTAEGFQSFALLWESVGQMLASRRA